MQNLNEGLLFDPALSAEIKDRFYYVDACLLYTSELPTT